MDEDRAAALWSYRGILYLLLIGMGAYLLADVSNVFVASYLQSQMTGSERVRIHKTEEPLSRSADYQTIVTKKIFDPTLGIVAAPVRVAPAPIEVPFIPPTLPPPIFTPPPVVVPPKPPLNIQLIGTVVRADDPSYAVIQDKRTGRQLIYRVGDFVREDAKIIQIDRNRVVLVRGDEEVILDFSGSSEDRQPSVRPTPQPVSLPPSSPPPPQPNSIRNISENRWMVDRGEIDHAVANLPEIMTKARVVPNFTDGKPDGFRIFAIQEDSLYAKIGLQNGDVLKRVNNIDIRDPQNLLQVFDRLKYERNIKIDLVRNAQEKTFDYIIR